MNTRPTNEELVTFWFNSQRTAVLDKLEEAMTRVRPGCQPGKLMSRHIIHEHLMQHHCPIRLIDLVTDKFLHR